VFLAAGPARTTILLLLVSQENVDTVRRIYEAFGKGDFARALEEADPDFEWIPPERDLQGPLQGLEDLRRFIEDQNEIFKDFRVEAEELQEHGDQVLALIRVRGEGRASSVAFDIRATTLWTFRGDRLIRGRVFPERDKALEAVGLPGEGVDYESR
jgi:ketosteroid isomerase-like protein